jgi:hypothetical protein
MTSVTVESPNDISISLENPFIPASVEVAGIGIQGAQGYSVLSGNGEPISFLGVNKDLYLDLDNGYLYKKISGSWDFQLNIAPARETFILDAGILSAQKVILDIVPRNSVLSVTFEAGIPQLNDGTHYYISGNELKWDGISPISGLPYTFQDLLEVDDVMIVTY